MPLAIDIVLLITLCVVCVCWYYDRENAKLDRDDAAWWKKRCHEWQDKCEKRTNQLVELQGKLDEIRRIL